MINSLKYAIVLVRPSPSNFEFENNLILLHSFISPQKSKKQNRNRT